MKNDARSLNVQCLEAWTISYQEYGLSRTESPFATGTSNRERPGLSPSGRHMSEHVCRRSLAYVVPLVHSSSAAPAANGRFPRIPVVTPALIVKVTHTYHKFQKEQAAYRPFAEYDKSIVINKNGSESWPCLAAITPLSPDGSHHTH